MVWLARRPSNRHNSLTELLGVLHYRSTLGTCLYVLSCLSQLGPATGEGRLPDSGSMSR